MKKANKQPVELFLDKLISSTKSKKLKWEHGDIGYKEYICQPRKQVWITMSGTLFGPIKIVVLDYRTQGGHSPNAVSSKIVDEEYRYADQFFSKAAELHSAVTKQITGTSDFDRAMNILK